MTRARVVKIQRGAADCDIGGEVVRARTSRIDVCTGDYVDVRFDDGLESWIVDAVEPRTSAIRRASSGGTSSDQVLAANVDTVVVAVPLDVTMRAARVERLLAVAWSSGATPVVAATKADLCADPSRVVADLEASAPGCLVAAVSVDDPRSVGSLLDRLVGTVAVIGPSGAGKSTLCNALLGVDRFATGAVRRTDGKGRHTTVHRELVRLHGGRYLIDTPGLRSIGLWGSDSGIELAFNDIDELAAVCRFADCAHDGEPGCAVGDAVESGTLTARRVESFRKLQRENEWITARTDARLRSERARAWKKVAKEQRRAQSERGRR